MKKTLQRGFTLIELLVVIAIIGILAAVVLASLNDARDGGQDAAIKQSVGNVRSQAEIVYNKGGYTYANVCADTNIIKLMDATADNRSATTDKSMNRDAASSGTTVVCNDIATGYAALAPLVTTLGGGAAQAWCVDSTGYAGTTTVTALGAGTDITCR